MPAPSNYPGGSVASGGQGRGRGLNASASLFQPGNATSRESKPRGRGRGAGASSSRRTSGRGDGSKQPAGTQKQHGDTTTFTSPFAPLKGNSNVSAPSMNAGRGSVSSQFGKPSTFTGVPNANGGGFGTASISHTSFGSAVDRNRDPRRQLQKAPREDDPSNTAAADDSQVISSYQDRYDKLRLDRSAQREQAIQDGIMADPNQPTSLNQAITPVGSCTSMCPEYERVERIVQKMVDKSEKYLDSKTGTLQIMESKMLKRFRRSAAGYDAQLPSDIRTPKTLLQTMNYLTRHVIGGLEPLGVIHKFVWDRTRSIRNDFSIQQLTQEDDVRMAVACLERIARFHIISLHLLSSADNQEPFDHHQEREQLNNTLLSLMYYYDDNQGRNMFPNEEEFRAYYIVFAIHDQRPDLESRVQKWQQELLRSPRVQVALELFAAASNTWEYQGALDEKRPNAVAPGLYTRFFQLMCSPSVSYLMACVAEIYFNTVRQTAIRSIWKAYCRAPLSQQHKNDEWTLGELTDVLYFDDDTQTVAFCNHQGLTFAQNIDGEHYLSWGSQPIDTVVSGSVLRTRIPDRFQRTCVDLNKHLLTSNFQEFQPSSEQTFSERLVESKRGSRNLAAIILGLNICQAASHGMVDTLIPSQATSEPESIKGLEEDTLFVSENENEELDIQADVESGPPSKIDEKPASPSLFRLSSADSQLPSAFPQESLVSGTPSSMRPFQTLSAPRSNEQKTSTSPFPISLSQGFTPLPAISSNPFAPQIIPPRLQSVVAPQVGSAQKHFPTSPIASPQQSTAKPSSIVRPSKSADLIPPSMLLKSREQPSPTSSQPFSISAAIAKAKSTSQSNQSEGGNSSIFDSIQPQMPSGASTPLFSFNTPKDGQFPTASLSTTPQPSSIFPLNAQQEQQNVTPQPTTTTQAPSIFSFSPPKADQKTATSQSFSTGTQAPPPFSFCSQNGPKSAFRPSPVSPTGPPMSDSHVISQSSTSTVFNPFSHSGTRNSVNNKGDGNISHQEKRFSFNTQPEIHHVVASTVSPSPGIFFANSSPRVPKQSLDAVSSKPDAQMASATKDRHVPFAHTSAPRRDRIENDIPALKESAASSGLPSSLGFSNSQTSLFQQLATPSASHELDRTEEPSLRASELLTEPQLEDSPFIRNNTHDITVDARGKASSLNHKRLFQDAEPEPCPPADGLVDAPPKKTKSIVQPRKSLARASIAPLPTLPILDVVKKLTDKKQVSEDIEPAPQSQVDEDEILLSAARIAAESLKNGPSLLDEMRSYSSSLLNGPGYYSSSVFGKSLSSAGNKDQTSWPYARIHGHNVALAPDGPLGLGRTMSRTEQRIRSTGGKGLAYKPLDLSSGKTPPKGKAPQ